MADRGNPARSDAMVYSAVSRTLDRQPANGEHRSLRSGSANIRVARCALVVYVFLTTNDTNGGQGWWYLCLRLVFGVIAVELSRRCRL